MSSEEKEIKRSEVIETLERMKGTAQLCMKLAAGDEDLESEFERMATMYQMEAGQIASFIGEPEKENMRHNLAMQKAVEFLYDHATITEASEELDFDEAE